MDIKRIAMPLLLGGLLAAPLAAQAVEYTAIQQDKSNIAFGYKQMAWACRATSRSFPPAEFRPGQAGSRQGAVGRQPGQHRHRFRRSQRAGGGQGLVQHQAISERALRFQRDQTLGGNRFQVDGKLTIKGRTQPVSTVATMTPQGNAAAFDGVFTIKRADFAIGEGDWKDFGTVANEIQIKFHLLARAK
ncbi:Uncharacterized conserved protein [Chromobacterium violaceum]|uniref:Uncharacterized conserved protein n=1 Tax=Chromobacterium violaceum TaxID=536 RepID=A0A447THK5_CHRVL|nr:Uncharacterized conserved protein [Chromobacterium violaceum]